MPTYEYACRDCAQHLEVVQSFKDDPLTVCGSCGGALRKVFSAAGIIFKGSGYYVNDSRGSGAKSSKAAPAAADSGGSSGSGDGASSGSSGSSDSSKSGKSTSTDTGASSSSSGSGSASEAKSA